MGPAINRLSMNTLNYSSDKPLIIRWIGPVLMVIGLLSVVQGLTTLLGGMELPGAPVEMNEFMRATAKVTFPMGFAYLVVGYAFFLGKRIARPMVFWALIFGGVIYYFVYQSSSENLQRIFLGQIPGLVIMTFGFLWYFYKKKNVVQYYQTLPD